MQLTHRIWTQLVEDFYRPIYRYAYQFLGNREEAEDAVQEIFIKAYHSYERLRDTDLVKPWLYSIARNYCRDRSRWWKRYLAFITNNKLKVVEQLENQLSHKLREAIQELPVRQREVFILRHWHDFSTEQTAELLGLSPGTVKSHLKRAIDTLKKKMLSNEPESSRICDKSSVPHVSIEEQQ